MSEDTRDLSQLHHTIPVMKVHNL